MPYKTPMASGSGTHQGTPMCFLHWEISLSNTCVTIRRCDKKPCSVPNHTCSDYSFLFLIWDKSQVWGFP